MPRVCEGNYERHRNGYKKLANIAFKCETEEMYYDNRVDDYEKQREKMAAEFYMNYRRDIEAYEERIQHFIDNGCDSAAVIERWLNKIEALKLKKSTYEQVLKRQLDDLDRDFALLQMQSQELSVRAGKNQIKMPLAA